MSSIQEMKEIAEELQLRGDEKKNFIIEQMDKLHKLQAEKEQREAEAKLQAEKEEREAKLRAEKEEALEAFCRLSETEATDYDRVKEVLQKRYNLTEDGYRQRFHTCSQEEGENPSMFIVRLKTYLERWMKLAEAPQTYEALRDLFVKEQFLDSSPADLSTYLRERRLAYRSGEIS
ncbi:hypothetical protein RRG08_015506 [Elysia crispata]|uniref:SCAN box domain-containing protein n=1 Tax=Elysia crispata TaxID=231223 RepID=A0AAE1AEM1_9GAST|nr:hypothetical protein RRG08_015506 [Elysia crispata]